MILSVNIRIILVFVIILILSSSAFATPEYAERSEQGCLTCHTDEEGGGELTTEGLEFDSYRHFF